MDYTIVAVKVESRENNAMKVQETFTDYGCTIKVRLGLHDLPGDPCISSGLIVLEVQGENIDDLVSALGGIDGVTAKKVVI